MVFQKECFEKVDFKNQQMTKKHKKLPRGQSAHQTPPKTCHKYVTNVKHHKPYCIFIFPFFFFNSFPAGDKFCRLLITFANSLDPDKAQQKVGPDLDPNSLTL